MWPATNGWLVATVAASAATVGVMIWLVRGSPLANAASPGEITRYVMTRVSTFAVLSYLTVWTSRNYRAHRHLQVLNQHRNKALITFQTFVSAAGTDDATKNAVLLEATRCIFNAGPTAYATEERDGGTVPIIEIVKSFVDKGRP
jgi:hypothetical protein